MNHSGITVLAVSGRALVKFCRIAAGGCAARRFTDSFTDTLPRYPRNVLEVCHLKVEPAVRIELTTRSLQNCCSTTELSWRGRTENNFNFSGATVAENTIPTARLQRKNPRRAQIPSPDFFGATIFFPARRRVVEWPPNLKGNQHGRFTSRRQTGSEVNARGSRAARTRVLRAPARRG